MSVPDTLTHCYFPGCPDHLSPTDPRGKDPRANHEDLIAWANRQRRAFMLEQDPPAWLIQGLQALYESSETFEDYQNAYTFMEDAGVACFHLGENRNDETRWEMRR